MRNVLLLVVDAINLNLSVALLYNISFENVAKIIQNEIQRQVL